MAGTVVFIESVSNDGGDPGATAVKAVDGSTITGWVSSASVALNVDIFLTGTTSVGDRASNTSQYAYGMGAGIVGEPWDFSSGGTDEGNYIYIISFVTSAIDTFANGGFGIVVADDLATDSVGVWYVGPQAGFAGGWEYFVVNPARAFNAVLVAGTGAWTTGGNPAQLSGVDGIGPYWDSITALMGATDNCFVQTISVGVGYRITGTDCVFSEFSTYETTNRYGALQTKSGTLFPLCKLRVGTPSGAGNTTFIDSGFTVIWQGHTLADGTTKATGEGFYGFYVDQGTGTTDVTLTNGTLAAASPETFDLVLSGGNTATITNLAVDRARLVTLDSTVTWDGGTVKASGQVAASGSIFKNVNVIESTVATDTGAVYWNDAGDPNGNLDGCSFTKGTNSHHGIEFGLTAPLSITLTDISFSGFTNTVGSTAAPLYIKRTTGTVTINLIGCSGITVDGYKSDGAIVNIISGSVTVAVKTTTTSGTAIGSARVLLKASDGTGAFPFEEAVTITRSGAVATVAHTGHGMLTNDYIQIYGADQPEYDGVKQITYIDANSYSYTVSGTPATPATGTITGTFVALYGLTDGSGNISTSRVYGVTQPVVGWARKSTSAPYYKEGILTGSISTTTGYSATAVMVLDE